MAVSELPAQAGARARRPVQPSASRRNWELLRELVRRDLQSRHKGSTLGAGWSLLNPLLYMAVYTLVFSTIARFPTPVPYPVYLMPALLAWNFFAQGLSYSANSVYGNATLVKKVAFPWILLAVSSVTAAFINYLISLLLLVPLLLIYHIGVGAPLLLVPVIGLVIYAMALGFGLLLAAGNVYFRDIEYLLGILLTLWFFLTPVVYPIAKVGGLDLSFFTTHNVHDIHLGKWVVYANPVTHLTTAFQDTIAVHSWPANPVGLLYSCIVAAVALIAGVWVFLRVQGGFAEEL